MDLNKYVPQIGMRAHDLPANTPKKLSECADSLGIPYIQLALRKSFNEINWTNHTFSTGLAEKINSDLGGLRVAVLGSYINLLAEGEALEHEKAVFRQNMLFAKYLNAGVVGTETGMSDHSEKDYQKLLKTVRELTADAEKLGVMIGIEGVAYHTINTPKMMRRLLDDVNSPNIMTIFDPVNYLDSENYINQDKMLKEAFELLADKMTAIHLKDFEIADGKIKNVRIGQGIFNIRLLFEYIKQYKPYIDVLIEGGKPEDFGDDCKLILKYAE